MKLWILVILLILIQLFLIFILILKCENKPINKSVDSNILSSDYPFKKNFLIKIPYRVHYQSYIRVKYIMFNQIYKIANLRKEKYSIEHIVPQSIYVRDGTIKKDMHNLILYPKNMNSHRSNYKYVDDPRIYGDSIILNTCGDIIKYQRGYKNKHSIKSNKLKIFHPQKKYKGKIARACMYFIKVYNLKDIIFKYVIDPYTILLWHHQHPVSNFEKKKNKIIMRYQKNENRYVSHPEKLVSDMESLLDIKLPSFRYYQY